MRSIPRWEVNKPAARKVASATAFPDDPGAVCLSSLMYWLAGKKRLSIVLCCVYLPGFAFWHIGLVDVVPSPEFRRLSILFRRSAKTSS